MEKLDNIVMYSPKDVSKLLHLGNTKCLELLSEKHVFGQEENDMIL